MYFVPAFSGLFAPYWRSDARGAIVGLSRYNTNAHIARATLESICYQSRDVAEAMEQDSGVTLDVLKVDGGVTANGLCMQIQADMLGVPVSRPVVRRDHRARAPPTPPVSPSDSGVHRRAAAELERVGALAADLVGGAARRGLRQLEEGGPAHPRLGRRGLTRRSTGSVRSRPPGRAAARRAAARRASVRLYPALPPAPPRCPRRPRVTRPHAPLREVRPRPHGRPGAGRLSAIQWRGEVQLVKIGPCLSNCGPNSASPSVRPDLNFACPARRSWRSWPSSPAGVCTTRTSARS